MKILITGAGGFIGSHLSEVLINSGHKVRLFLRYTSKKDFGWLEEKFSNLTNCEIHWGDIANFDSVQNAMSGVTHVVNLAAMISVPYSFLDPLSCINTNINGFLNIARAAKSNKKIKKIIQISSSEIYGNRLAKNKKFLFEDDLPSPESPYAASKIASDALAISLYKTNKLPITIARPFNTFGPRQSLRAVIPTIITQMIASKKPILKLGNLNSQRDLVYVDDTVDCIIKLLFSGKSTDGEIYNISTGKSFSVKQIIQIVKDYTKKTPKIKIEQQRKRSSEVHILRGSNNKIKKKFKIKSINPDLNFKKGVIKTIQWFQIKNNIGKYKNIKKYNI